MERAATAAPGQKGREDPYDDGRVAHALSLATFRASRTFDAVTVATMPSGRKLDEWIAAIEPQLHRLIQLE